MTNRQKKSRYVIIKGTKDGLSFLLDDQCSLEELKRDLQDTLADRPETLNVSQGPVKAKLLTGKRYLDHDQMSELESLFSKEMNVVIDSIETEVITKDEAAELAANSQIHRIVKVIRSGQVLELQGDILLIGDVNPGGTVKATGNIYILGNLRGMAHAGCEGNEEAVICASAMKPSQLRIASVIRRPPEEEVSGGKPSGLECAFINEDKDMILDKLSVLGRVRPGLSMNTASLM